MKASLFQNRIVFGLAFALLVATANAADAGHGATPSRPRRT